MVLVFSSFSFAIKPQDDENNKSTKIQIHVDGNAILVDPYVYVVLTDDSEVNNFEEDGNSGKYSTPDRGEYVSSEIAKIIVVLEDMELEYYPAEDYKIGRVVANEPETYSVTYDGNGSDSGTPPSDSTDYVSGAEVTVLGNTDLTKDGFTFIGWNTASNGSGDSYEENDSFNIMGDVTLYAMWEEETSNGGGGTTTTTTSTATINAVSDEFTTTENTELIIETSELLANDEDYETFESVQNPTNGSVSLSGTTITFTPDLDFTGIAYFYYTIADGDDEDTAIVVITVEEGIIIEEEITPLGPGDPDALVVLEPDMVPLGTIEYSLPYILGYPDISFRPNRQITRGEMATIFSRILQLNLNNFEASSYDDVNPDDWYAKHIEAVTQLGVMGPYEENMFKPERPLTHGEMAEAFSNYWEIIGLDLSDEGDYYTDIDGHPLESEINRFYNSGISVGFIDGRFKPDSFTTRVELIIMVNRVLNRVEVFMEEPSFNDVDMSHWGYGAIEASTRGFEGSFLDE